MFAGGTHCIKRELCSLGATKLTVLNINLLTLKEHIVTIYIGSVVYQISFDDISFLL